MPWLIVVLYAAALAYMAWLGWRKTGSLEDHIIAGRKMPVWLSAFTMAATVIGTGIVLGVSELAYQYGVSAMLYPALLGLALGLSVVVAAGKFRASEAVTVAELLGRHYGENARVLVAAASAIKWIGPTAAQYLAVGAIIHSATGMAVEWAILISAVIITAYVIAGGTWAIAYTDSTQLVIVYIGLILVVMTGYPIYGGVFELAEKLGPLHQTWDGVGGFRLTTWIGAVVALTFADQVWLQRSASVKNPRDALKAGLYGALMVFPIGLLTVYAGLAAAVALPDINPRTAVPSLIFNMFDPAVATLFVGAIVAASMSSCDSWLHSSATLLVKDIYVEKFRPGATEEHTRKIMNLVTALLSLGAVILALSWKGGIITLVFATMVWGSCFYIGPLLLIWYSPVKISPGAGLFIMAATLVVGTGLSFHPPFGLSPLLISAFLCYALTAGAWLISRRSTS